MARRSIKAPCRAPKFSSLDKSWSTGNLIPSAKLHASAHITKQAIRLHHLTHAEARVEKNDSFTDLDDDAV